MNPSKASEMAVEMERALLGCTTHCSGVLMTWHRCIEQCQSPEEIAAIGHVLLERSEARLERAKKCWSDRGINRERLLQPFIAQLFHVEHSATSAG